MTSGYNTLARSESSCSLNSSKSSPGPETAVRKLPTEPTILKQPSVYVFRCRYCNESFLSRKSGTEGSCQRAPNYARENVDRLCIVQGFRGCWYHLTKDEISSDEEYDVLRMRLPQAMTVSLWIQYILLCLICFPCLCLWLPFALWEKKTRYVFGSRHSIRRRKQINRDSYVPPVPEGITEKETALLEDGTSKEVRINMEGPDVTIATSIPTADVSIPINDFTMATSIQRIDATFPTTDVTNTIAATDVTTDVTI